MLGLLEIVEKDCAWNVCLHVSAHFTGLENCCILFKGRHLLVIRAYWCDSNRSHVAHNYLLSITLEQSGNCVPSDSFCRDSPRLSKDLSLLRVFKTLLFSLVQSSWPETDSQLDPGPGRVSTIVLAAAACRARGRSLTQWLTSIGTQSPMVTVVAARSTRLLVRLPPARSGRRFTARCIWPPCSFHRIFLTIHYIRSEAAGKEGGGGRLQLGLDRLLDSESRQKWDACEDICLCQHHYTRWLALVRCRYVVSKRISIFTAPGRQGSDPKSKGQDVRPSRRTSAVFKSCSCCRGTVSYDSAFASFSFFMLFTKILM